MSCLWQEDSLLRTKLLVDQECHVWVKIPKNPGPYGPVWSCSGGLITSATASEGQRTGEEQEPGSARAPPP
ncbi:unnamed protein product [Arctogadus glacialis]